jgi:hypothetical protein
VIQLKQTISVFLAAISCSAFLRSGQNKIRIIAHSETAQEMADRG